MGHSNIHHALGMVPPAYLFFSPSLEIPPFPLSFLPPSTSPSLLPLTIQCPPSIPVAAVDLSAA